MEILQYFFGGCILAKETKTLLALFQQNIRVASFLSGPCAHEASGKDILLYFEMTGIMFPLPIELSRSVLANSLWPNGL